MAISGSIHIYPAREMLALDMAELIAATYINKDGIIQGCAFSIVNGKLHMTKGRMIIMGRLCVVDSDGDFDLPDDISGKTDTQHRYVMAVCDLTASEPFYVKIFSASEYYAVEEADSMNSADDYINFNVNNGVHIFKLGTVDINPATGAVTAWKPFAAASIKNNKTQTSAMNNSVTELRTELTNTITTNVNAIKDSGNTTVSLATLNSWVNYLKKRAFAIGKWHFENREFDGVVIGGNKVVTVRFPSTWYFNRVMIPFASSNSTAAAATAANDAMEYITQAKQQAMANKRLWSGIACYNDGAVIAKEKYTPSLSIPNDKYGVPTDINPNYYPVGQIAIVINNASSGGANYGNCLIQSFGWDGDNFFYVRVRNVGSGQAKVNVIARIAFVQGM